MNSTLTFCPRCGAATEPTVCSNCGYTFPTLDSTETKEEEFLVEQEEKRENKHNFGWIIAIILTVLFLLFLLLAILGFGGIVGYLVFASNNVNPSTNTPNIVNNSTLHFGDDDEEDDEDEDENENENDGDKDNDIEPEEDNNKVHDDSIKFSSGVSPYTDLIVEYDYDVLEDYLASGNEYYDEVANFKNDIFKQKNYYSYIGATHDTYGRDNFPTPYYEPIQDSIEYAKNYDIERRIVKYESDVNGILVNMYCAYYQIISDDEDFSEVNDTLRNQSLMYVNNFINDYSANLTDYSYDIFIDSFVTYNDEDIVSVLYDITSYNERNELDEILLFSVNVDVKNCAVMDNTKIVNIDKDFADFFVDRCTAQMGSHVYVNNLSNEEIQYMLTNEDTLIVYFSPLGLEIGYQYLYQGSKGWITCTINDFDEYITDEYDYDTSFGLGYDVFEYEKSYGTYEEQNGKMSDYTEIEYEDSF